MNSKYIFKYMAFGVKISRKIKINRWMVLKSLKTRSRLGRSFEIVCLFFYNKAISVCTFLRTPTSFYSFKIYKFSIDSSSWSENFRSNNGEKSQEFLRTQHGESTRSWQNKFAICYSSQYLSKLSTKMSFRVYFPRRIC